MTWVSNLPGASMNRFLVLLTSCLALPGALSAQPLTSSQVDDIASVFGDLDSPDTPGAAVAVIRHGEIVYSDGFGTAQLEYGIPIEPTTIFHVASVSKQFTAMAVLLLVEEGKIDLDADLRDYLDWVPDLGATVTPRHILSHTSGVRDQWELVFTAGWRMDDVITKADIRRLMTKQRGLNFPPGSRYTYSNMGYSLAAELVQEVSGMPFSDFVQQRILDPLGMERTHVHDDHEMIVPDRAYSYRASGEGFRNAVLSYANHGATSLFTTAEDLVRWLDNFRTRTVGASMLGELTERTQLNDGERIGYALGVFNDRYRGQPRIQHSGGDAGFRSQVHWFPEEEVGVAVVSNLGSSNPGQLANRVVDIVLAGVLEPLPESEEELAPSTASRETITLDAATLERYEGTYAAEITNATFEVRDGYLWLTAPNVVRLLATSDTSFVADDAVAAEIDFQVADGIATSLRVVQGELRFEATRITSDMAPQLDAYMGMYYSPEIETLYEVRRGEDGLVLYNLRKGDIDLVHRTGDTFSGSEFFVRELEFTRSPTGDVDGLTMSGSRVLNHRFVKLSGVLPGR